MDSFPLPDARDDCADIDAREEIITERLMGVADALITEIDKREAAINQVLKSVTGRLTRSIAARQRKVQDNLTSLLDCILTNLDTRSRNIDYGLSILPQPSAADGTGEGPSAAPWYVLIDAQGRPIDAGPDIDMANVPLGARAIGPFTGEQGAAPTIVSLLAPTSGTAVRAPVVEAVPPAPPIIRVAAGDEERADEALAPDCAELVRDVVAAFNAWEAHRREEPEAGEFPASAVDRGLVARAFAAGCVIPPEVRIPPEFRPPIPPPEPAPSPFEPGTPEDRAWRDWRRTPRDPGWYCIRRRQHGVTVGGAPSFTFRTSDHPLTAEEFIEGWQYVSGPFDTQEQALAECGRRPAPAPPPVIRIGPAGGGEERPEEAPPRQQAPEEPLVRAPEIKKLGAGELPDWCNVNVCKQIEGALRQLAQLMGGFLPEWVGAIADDNPETWGVLTGDWVASLPRLLQPNARKLLDTVFRAAEWLLEISLGTQSSCRAEDMTFPWLMGKIYDLLNQWSYGAFAPDARKWKYWLAYLCPTQIPSVGEYHRAYLANQITKDQWECGVKANDQCAEPARQVVESNRTRPTVNDWIRLRWRNPDIAAQADVGIRANGVLYQAEADALLDSARPWPSLVQVIDVATRGVFVGEAEARYGYTKGLAEVLGNDGRKWLGGAGGTNEYNDVQWVSHWRLPTVGEAVVMARRLVPGNVPNNVAVTQADLAHILDAHAVPPFWRERLLAISQHLPPLRTVQAEFIRGALQTGALGSILQQMGYSADNANIIVASYKQARQTAWEKSKDGRAYMSGAMSAPELLQTATSAGMPLDEADEILRALNRQIILDRRARCIKGARQQFMTGGYTAAQAQTALIQLGTDPSVAIEITAGWLCEQKTRDKAVPAAKLCEWFASGLLSSAEFGARLGILGYTAADVKRITSECQLKSREKAQRAQQRAAAAKEREAAHLASQAARRQKASQAAQARLRRDEQAQERRTGRLIQTIVGLTGSGVDDIGPATRAALNSAAKATNLDLVSAQDLLVAVLKVMKTDKATDWQARYEAAVKDLLRAERSGVESVPPTGRLT